MLKRYAIRIQDRDGFERRMPIGDVTLLGRQRACDVVLQDEMISRMHLRIECVDGECWAEDLDSSHGTFLDGRRIKKIKWEPATVLALADGAYRLLLVQERLQGSETSIHAILSTARHLTGEYDLRLILQKSLDHMLRLSGQERGFIMLPDPMDDGKLKIIVSRGMEATIYSTDPDDACAASGTRLSMTSVQSVFDTCEPIWVPEVSSDESLQMHQSIMELHLAAILCLPLLVKGKSIGIVYLDGRRNKLEPLDRGSFETIVGLCAVAIERVRLAEEGRQNKILAAVGTAASSIATEFCNTLESMSGHIGPLAGVCLDEVSQGHLSQIRTSLERLTSMSTKLLMFADIGSLEKIRADMSRFLHGKVQEWRERTKGSGIDIIGFGPECAANIRVQKISGVMDSLLANAIGALADSGPRGRIEISWAPTPGSIRIKVADNGKGIPPGALESAFDLHFTPGDDCEGGFGLAAAKMHVEGHGGTIGIESTLGKGTTVTIDLPLHLTEVGDIDGFTTHNCSVKTGGPHPSLD